MSDEEQEFARREVLKIVVLALAEDLGQAGDITSRAIFAPGDKGAASVFAREAGVVSGLEAAAEVCRQVEGELAFLPLVMDGQPVRAGAEIIRVEGDIIALLAAERTLLNFLSRLSGIATETARYVEAVSGTSARIAATRKTNPGLRYLEKQAVVHGGGEAHRQGLFDAVLIKDNHIVAAGGTGAAIGAVRRSLGEDVAIEIEVDDQDQLQEALAAGVDRVLLDNMTPAEVGACVSLTGGQAVIEASGGINLASVRAYAEAGADVISVGALTRAAAGIDFALEVEK